MNTPDVFINTSVHVPCLHSYRMFLTLLIFTTWPKNVSVGGDSEVAWDADDGADSKTLSCVCDLWVCDEACEALATAFNPAWSNCR